MRYSSRNTWFSDADSVINCSVCWLRVNAIVCQMPAGTNHYPNQWVNQRLSTQSDNVEETSRGLLTRQNGAGLILTPRLRPWMCRVKTRRSLMEAASPSVIDGWHRNGRNECRGLLRNWNDGCNDVLKSHVPIRKVYEQNLKFTWVTMMAKHSIPQS